jgi:hypothetical protein
MSSMMKAVPCYTQQRNLGTVRLRNCYLDPVQVSMLEMSCNEHRWTSPVLMGSLTWHTSFSGMSKHFQLRRIRLRSWAPCRPLVYMEPSGVRICDKAGNVWTSHIIDENIDCGSDINFRDKIGFIPLHAASRWGHFDVARLLLDCGSDVNAREAHSLTPLD